MNIVAPGSSQVSATEAAAAFDQACELGLGIGCNNAAVLSSGGQQFTRTSTTLASALARGDPAPLRGACDNGDGEGCFLLAAAYQAGRGVGLDVATARELYSRSCDLGWALSCGELAGLYLRGEGGAPDPARAAGSFNLGCASGDAMSCLRLGLLLQSDQIQTPDPERARSLIQLACEMGLSQACDFLDP